MGSSWTGSSTGLVAFRAGLKTIGQLRAVLNFFVLVQAASGGDAAVPPTSGGALSAARALAAGNTCPWKPKAAARGSDASSATVRPPSESESCGAGAVVSAAASSSSTASMDRVVGPCALRRPLCTASAPAHTSSTPPGRPRPPLTSRSHRPNRSNVTVRGGLICARDVACRTPGKGRAAHTCMAASSQR